MKQKNLKRFKRIERKPEKKDESVNEKLTTSKSDSK